MIFQRNGSNKLVEVGPLDRSEISGHFTRDLHLKRLMDDQLIHCRFGLQKYVSAMDDAGVGL